MIYTPIAPLPNNDNILSLELIKQYLYLDTIDTSEDTLLTLLRDSVISFCEKYTGRVLQETTFKLTTQKRVNDYIRISKTPLSAINSVKQNDIEFTTYSVTFGDKPYIRLDELSNDSIDFEVEFVAGYKTSQFPIELKLSLLEHIAYQYENRGDCCESSTPKSILAKYSICKVPVI